MSKSSVALLVALAACMTSAQDIGLGKCNEAAKPMENFKAADYMGLWYEQKKYFAIFEFLGKCITAEYSINSDGTVRVLNKQKNSVTNIESSIEGTATLVNGTSVGALSVKFPSAPFNAPYNVVSTDYTNYAIVYSCVDVVSAVNAEFLWLLTRERKPSQAVIDEAIAQMKSVGLNTDKLNPTDQTNCD